jgi:hypothetical protein
MEHTQIEISARRSVSMRRCAIVCAALAAAGGCQTMTDLCMVPIEMAEHGAVAAAQLPYESAKIGVKGLAQAISDVGR